MFSESWRADCARHQEETINAVKATAQEQVPYNVEGVRHYVLLLIDHCLTSFLVPQRILKGPRSGSSHVARRSWQAEGRPTCSAAVSNSNYDQKLVTYRLVAKSVTCSA